MLQENFKEWIEPDIAVYLMAKHLGMMPFTEESKDFSLYRNFKSIWWTNNVYNIELYNILESMIKMGFMEKCENEDDKFCGCFRWISGATL